MYRFVYHDGRTGVAPTAWRAIVAAVGPAEAQALPDLEDVAWSYAAVTDGPRDYVKSGKVRTREDVFVGTMFALEA